MRPLPFSDRSAANFPTAFLTRPENAQTQRTYGVDFEANYSAPLLGGDLALRGLLTWQPHFYQEQFEGAPRLDLADVPPLAKWRATVYVHYENGPWSLDLQERWRSSFQFNAGRSFVYAEPRIPSTAYTNVTVSVKTSANSQFYVSARNLFDRQPDPWSMSPLGTPGVSGGFPLGDDNIGRYLTAGFRANF